MSRKASNFQKVVMSLGYRGKEIFKHLNTGRIDIGPSSIKHILITHQDTDHVGAVERDSDGLFRNAKLYLSEIAHKVLSFLPDDFEGELLDVPVGTAVFTEEQLLSILHRLYKEVEYHVDGSTAYFRCVK